MKTFETWTVLPHGRLTPLDRDLLTVVGDLHMPIGDVPRRMTVVRLEGGRLVIYSAIALDEEEMQKLERFGAPAFLVVPSEIHRMDAKVWKARYPQMRVVAPPGSLAKIQEVVPVDDAGAADFGDPHVHYATVEGTEGHEAALIVERPTGSTLIVNDVIWNVDHRPGFGGWLLRLAGFTGGRPKVPNLVAMRTIKDRGAFRGQLEEWSHIEKLRRIVVSHGEVIAENAPAVLRELSTHLAA
jgi:hypothetical protein